ncbi:MAG: hypothetical protein LBJ91_03320, partial [Clostridiales Family XIII bacterium]|nr:hypothetical protein [Clostridiales Family XIII bacterium]
MCVSIALVSGLMCSTVFSYADTVEAPEGATADAAVETPVEPVDAAVETSVEPTDAAVETPDESTDAAVETPDKATDAAIEISNEPTDAAVETPAPAERDELKSLSVAGSADAATAAEIKAALADSSIDVIVLTSNAYSLATVGALTVDRDITIKSSVGAGSQINSGGVDRHIRFAKPGLTLKFENVTLNGNRSVGGIECSGDDGVYTIDGAVIRLCYQLSPGGGIAAMGAGMNLVLNDCTITENISDQNGGGVFCFGDVTLNDSSIKGNAAQALDPYESAQGGGVCANGSAYINNSRITNNTTDRYGGGVAVFGKEAVITDGSDISGNLIIHKPGDCGGGGIFTDSGSVTIKGKDITMNSNNSVKGSAIRCGGDLNINDGTTVAADTSNIIISGNDLSYAIYAVGKNVAISGNVTFAGNFQVLVSATAQFDVNVMVEYHHHDELITVGNFDITGGAFRNNYSYMGRDVGMIYSRGDAHFYATDWQCINNDFDDRYTVGHFDGLTDGPSVKLDNCIVRGNKNRFSIGSFGALFYVSSDDVEVRNCLFEDNYGAKSAVFRTWNTTTITGSTFRNNKSDDAGTVLESYKTTILTDSVFMGNKSAYGGGTIRLSDNATVSGCTFEDNSVAGNVAFGGAIYHTGYRAITSVSISDSTFTGNKSGSQSGAVHIEGAAEVVIDKCMFTGNSASRGGAVSFGDEVGKASVRNTVFTDNSAAYCGGGVYVSDKIAADFENDVFDGNRQTSSSHDDDQTDINGGGGIYAASLSNVRTKSCAFRNNMAASVCAEQLPATAQAIHSANIVSTSYTAPFAVAYNNADINYASDKNAIIYMRNYDAAD